MLLAKFRCRAHQCKDAAQSILVDHFSNTLEDI